MGFIHRVGPGKDFRKNGLSRSNGRNTETKRYIVMGPTAKLVTAHRAKNALFANIGLPKQKIGFWAKMRQLRQILGRYTFWF